MNQYNSGVVNVQIVNVFGKIIYNEINDVFSENIVQIDMRDFSDGLYFVNVNSDKNTHTQIISLIK